MISSRGLGIEPGFVGALGSTVERATAVATRSSSTILHCWRKDGRPHHNPLNPVPRGLAGAGMLHFERARNTPSTIAGHIVLSRVTFCTLMRDLM